METKTKPRKPLIRIQGRQAMLARRKLKAEGLKAPTQKRKVKKVTKAKAKPLIRIAL